MRKNHPGPTIPCVMQNAYATAGEAFCVK